MKYKFFLFVLTVMFSCVCIKADKANLLYSNLTDKPPVIDGHIGDVEWQDAAETSGSRIINSTSLELRKVHFYFCCSSKNLYFACKSELPPPGMKLLSRVKKRDGRVHIDDAVEFIFMPPDGKAVYQIIANSIGTFFDAKYKMENGGITVTKPLPWNPNIKVANRFVDGYWCLEMQIPLRDFQSEHISPLGKWKAQMTRDWKQPAQWACWNKSRDFCEPTTMGEIVVSKNSPILKFKGLGEDFVSGKVNARVIAYNPDSQPRSIACRVDITSITSPKTCDEKKTLLPTTKATFSLNFIDKTKARYECRILGKNTKTGQILLRENFTWEPNSEASWSIAKEKQASLDFSFYPYLKTVKAGLKLQTLKNRKNLSAVKFIVIAPSGKHVTGKKVKVSSTAKIAETLLRLPALNEGEYKIQADLRFSGNNKTLTYERKFVYKKFPWEHNRIGMDDIIIPPFRPLQVEEKKKTVKALLTGYKIKDGFWNAIYAQGENILASPVKLIINDGKIRMKENGFEFKKTGKSEVIAQSQLQSETLQLHTEHVYEQDGMCKLKITLKPQIPIKINSCRLEIPVRSRIAQLMHTVNNNMRYNPAQYIPRGTSRVWDSSQAKENPKMTGNFMPYMWLGYIYKGLSWFASSDKGWSRSENKPALEIIRKKDTVVLRINIINKPITLSKPVTYVMGILPTPVKPRLHGWRRFCERWKPRGIKHALKTALFAGTQTYGCQFESSPWPMNHDYSIVNLLSKANRKEPVGIREKTADAFIKKHFSQVKPREYGFIERHIKRGIRFSKDCSYAIPYINPRASSLDWNGYQVYMDEWWGTEYRANMDGGYNNTFLKSSQDMRLYYAQKLVQAGMDGIYYDNIRDWPVFDPVKGPAYKLPDGKIQPYFDIFQLREFMKRTAVMLCLNKKTFPDGRPVFTAHMTNTNLVPLLSFCAITLDMEAWYGASDFQTRFSEGYILSESLGTQTGCVPQVLVKISGNDKLRVSRTFIATALAYDLTIVENCGGLNPKLWQLIKKIIMNFGYGTDKVAVYPCWKKQNFIKPLSQGVKVALYQKTNKSMLVVSGFEHRAGEVSVDIKGLRYSSVKVYDAETGREVKVKNGVIKIFLPKHDFKILIIEDSKNAITHKGGIRSERSAS
jgi:hypothetical protein